MNPATILHALTSTVLALIDHVEHCKNCDHSFTEAKNILELFQILDLEEEGNDR